MKGFIPKVAGLLREALAGKNYAPDDLEAGRAYVHAYIRLMHHAEHLYGPAAAAERESPYSGVPQRTSPM